MPLVVVTTSEDKRRSADAEIQAGQVLRLADRLFECLTGNFTVASWKIFEGFSEEALAGDAFKAGDGAVRPSSFAVPVPNARPLDESPEGAATNIHNHHCLVIHGSFRISDLPPVPARFEVNLYRQWAKEEGDIVFDTFKTGDVSADGLYELVWQAGQPGLQFAERFGRHLSDLNNQIERGPRVRWASIKDVDGAEEPSNNYAFLYRLDDMKMSRLIRSELMRIAEEVGRPIYESSDLRAVGFYRKTVEDMVGELSSFPLFDQAAETVGAEEGLIRVETGSVLFIDRRQGGTGRAATKILDAVGENFRNELRRRIGAAQTWPDPLSRLISSG